MVVMNLGSEPSVPVRAPVSCSTAWGKFLCLFVSSVPVYTMRCLWQRDSVRTESGHRKHLEPGTEQVLHAHSYSYHPAYR